MALRAAAVLVLAAVTVSLTLSSAAPATSPRLRILVFTKTEGFRHDSIPAAIKAVQELGTRNSFDVDATEDATAFSDTNLARYDAVLFLLTTGDVLDDTQQAAFERYIRSGGGYAGVHSATDTERGWPWYGGLVGAWSSGHPDIQPAVVVVAEPRDASTAALPARWARTDEWYGFLTNPRLAVHVLLTLDETTYAPGDFAMGGDHPIAWWHAYDGGRAWYTQGGHVEAAYSDPLYLGHLLGGILYAATDPDATPAPAIAPVVAPPKILSLATLVRGRRVVVTARFSGCDRCSAEIRVRLSGRLSATRLSITGSTARGMSAAVPAGRRRFAVVVRDRTTGLSRTASRWVRIPPSETGKP